MNYTNYPVENNGRFHHVIVSHSEHCIHLGKCFTKFVSVNLGIDAFEDFTMTVPAGYRAHFTYSITSALKAQLQVFEDSEVTGGAVALARNRNEESGNTDTVSVRTGGTVSVPGTLLADITWGTSAAPVVGPNVGGESSDVEIIWPQNAVRRFRITSKVADNNIVVRFNFMMEPMTQAEIDAAAG